ncbi:MAG: GGDEF domain-containing protein [Sneathiella sp.]|nr:GGDEF domain-containing protein [Sneathiella sp.]
MTHRKEFVKAQAIAEKTMALLKERGIRQIPQNFTIWYEYLSESNPDLTIAVNELIAKNGKFSETVAREIYGRFFSFEKEGKAIRETNHLVQKSIENVIGDLNMTTSEISDYGDQLSDFAAKAVGLTVEDLQNAIGEIVSQTSTMSDNTKSLKTGLDSASREIAELKRRLQFVQKEAFTDALTGIANRKSFDAELSKLIEEARETSSSLCLIMADIDHFKKFNDCHGHTFGDQVIKLVATTLQKGIKAEAIAARYGGEEFAVILPDTELDAAVNIANDLLQSIAAKKLVKRSTGVEVGKVTLSFGVTPYALREDAVTFISRADEALYSAKKNGRNQVKHLSPLLTLAS